MLKKIAAGIILAPVFVLSICLATIIFLLILLGEAWAFIYRWALRQFLSEKEQWKEGQ